MTFAAHLQGQVHT